jgi:hypothetical protein
MNHMPHPAENAEAEQASSPVEDAESAKVPGSLWKQRLLRVEEAFNRRSGSPRARMWMLGIASGAFLVLTVLSFRALPDGTDFHWWLLPILILVTAPLTILINAAEFKTMAAINHHSVKWIDSTRLTVLAAASNLLPLPGGIVIRTQALRQKGSSYKGALAANGAAGIAWIGAGSITVGLLFLGTSGRRIAAAVLITVGLVCMYSVWALLRKTNRHNAATLLVRLLIIELLTVGIGAVRLFIAIRFIGESMTAVQAVAISGAGIISAAVGIFPAGLGLREALAGLIGTAVGLTAAESIAASAADRVTTQLGLALLSGLLVHHERRERRASQQVPASEVAHVEG